VLKSAGVSHAIHSGIYFVPGDRQRDGLFIQNDVFFNTVMPRFPLRKDGFAPNFRTLAEVTRSVVERTSLNPPNPRMIVNNLSGGNQQKVVFGKWLQFQPKVLLLNDPAKGVDIGAMRYLYDLVRGLAENGTTVILYASSNEELISNCDRVLIMFEGRFMKELKGDQLTDENLVKHSLRIDSARVTT
jgi:ribose transport system ATP-binding protein